MDGSNGTDKKDNKRKRKRKKKMISKTEDHWDITDQGLLKKV
jgi:hypothetical protein